MRNVSERTAAVVSGAKTLIELNGVRLGFSAARFTAYQQSLADSSLLRPLREQLGDAWFLHWDEGVVFGLPRLEGAPAFGEAVELQTDQSLRLLAARIADVLPERFPEYQAFRRRPFSFLGQRDELVSRVKPRLTAPPLLLDAFKIRPRFALDARLMELQDGDAFVALFTQVSMRWEVLHGLAFTTHLGTPLNARNVLRDYKRALVRAGLSEVFRFHDLRHAHATLMLQAGVSMKIASERLGHSAIGITMDLYTHALQSMDADAAELVQQALRGMGT